MLNKLKCFALENGAKAAAFADTKDIRFDKTFRLICETKSCGAYGTNWMYPPHIGQIEDLIEWAKQYERCFVFPTITELEDSFDIEGMLSAGKFINDLARKLKKSRFFEELGDFIVLGSGACGYCLSCCLNQNMECQFPSMSISSIEAYGIDAFSLADAGKLTSFNGKNTVTYYGVILFHDSEKGRKYE